MIEQRLHRANWKKWKDPFSFSLIALLLIILGSFGCTDLNNIGESDIENYNAHYAIPLINDRLSLESLIEHNVDNTSFRVDSTGKLTVLYKGDVLGKTMDQMFPPIPGLGYINLVDTSVNQAFVFTGSQTIDFGIFSGDNMKFKYRSELEEDIHITMRIPEIVSPDGDVFTSEFDLIYEGTTPVEGETEWNDLEGYHLYSTDNTITFIYDARRPNGERIKLDKAWMNFTEIAFEYIEGFFPITVQEIKGDVVPIGLYTKWVDGIMKFEDPKVTITVDNSFGFPVEAKVNTMFVHDLDWLVYPLESPLLEDGISFDFPSIDEIGEVKTTSYTFDTTNSNLNSLFSKKVRQLKYQVDAIVNPDNDPNIIGYMHESSFFNIAVAVEVPMLQTIDSLRITDTFDIQWQDLDLMDELQFKMLLQNEFPIDLDMQIYFLDDEQKVLDSLFEGKGVHMDAAVEIGEGITDPGEVKVYTISFDKDRIEQIKKSSKIVVNPLFSSVYGAEKPIWIYTHYGLDFKMGVDFIISN